MESLGNSPNLEAPVETILPAEDLGHYFRKESVTGRGAPQIPRSNIPRENYIVHPYTLAREFAGREFVGEFVILDESEWERDNQFEPRVTHRVVFLPISQLVCY